MAFFNRGIVLSVLIMAGPILAILKLTLSLYTWRNTLVVITSERVGFFHQKGLLKREFYECPLGAIMQVSHQVSGLSQTIFNFGTVTVNTGDAESSIAIKDVPNPFDIQQEIQNALGR
ncbi:MAG TPA: PH domain-containing protein [Verrucomicrobiae bacterium]|nr:PH domain-containing protein [Verrucomicrobiae bacterium]